VGADQLPFSGAAYAEFSVFFFYFDLLLTLFFLVSVCFLWCRFKEKKAE
jgi:hypothetical protein